MKKLLLLSLSILAIFITANSQCNPQGDQVSYGSNNQWIGYVYNNSNLTSYAGYVIEGTTGSPVFDENFGGNNTNFKTAGCQTKTETFSVRFKLEKTLYGIYNITVGGDDGFRLSLDGGNTWVINQWNDHPYASKSYSAQLNGTYKMVLEYYENGGENRVSFDIKAVNCSSGSTSGYGSNNSWNAYLYQGMNFESYVGMIHDGSATDASFDQNFGGTSAKLSTSGCDLATSFFSARYRLAKYFPGALYHFQVSGDDGYRLSLDGGQTWLINNWGLHSMETSDTLLYLDGNYNMVLEYFENDGNHTLSFAYSVADNVSLPITLIDFQAHAKNQTVEINWEISADSNPEFFEIEKSNNGIQFKKMTRIEKQASSISSGNVHYSYTDGAVNTGECFYRLKMTDQEGKVSYSKNVRVLFANAAVAPSLNVYPTVLSGSSFYLKTSVSVQQAVVQVRNSAGVTVSSTKFGMITAGQPVEIKGQFSSLAHGVYIVSLQSAEQATISKRIIIE